MQVLRRQCRVACTCQGITPNLPSPCCRLEELQRRLESLEASASTEHTQTVQLSAQLSKTESGLRAAQSSLDMAERETQSLRQQLLVGLRV